MIKIYQQRCRPSISYFNLERITREQGEILNGNKGTELKF